VLKKKVDKTSYCKTKNQRYDLMSLCEYYAKVTLHSTLPFLVRRHTPDKGLAVFARDKNTSFVTIQQHLIGFNELIPENSFDLFEGYPSLWRGRSTREGSSYIIYGPASLLNHKCNSGVEITEVDIEENISAMGARVKELLKAGDR
jgi:hypothetical protein